MPGSSRCCVLPTPWWESQWVLRVNASAHFCSISFSENRRESSVHELGRTLDRRTGSALPTGRRAGSAPIAVRASAVPLRLPPLSPSLGVSLRKAWFRMVGTVIGAGVIVVLTARFPQDRAGFLLGLALWGGACALVATLLRNFAGYAAALAGLTAAVIASDELGAVGGANNDVFMFAVPRASEICIGIICAGVVLASTGFVGARHRLAAH